MGWIAQNQATLQAISGLGIFGLTLVLIVLTAIYARANWRTMRILEADLRFRSQPIPSLSFRSMKTVDPAHARDPLARVHVHVDLTVTTSNAVLMLEEVELGIVLDKNFEAEERVVLFHGDHLRPIALNGSAAFQHGFEHLGSSVTEYRTSVVYYDLSKNFKFLSYFENNIVQFTISDPLTPSFLQEIYNRLRKSFEDMQKN